MAQVNNVYVFPGLGLGVVAGEATSITDDMVTAASLAVAAQASESPTPSLLPPIERGHDVARAVAFAVARQAVLDGVAPANSDAELRRRIGQTCWYPHY